MMEMLKGSVTQKDWMAVGGILGATLLVVAIFVFFVHGAQIKTLDAVTQDDEQVKADLVQAHAKEAGREALLADVAKTEKLVADFEKKLPSTREIPQLWGTIEGMATRLGLKVDVTPATPKREERKETFRYNITPRGTFHQIVTYINHLEGYERYMKVSELNIKEEQNGVSTATFTLETYRFVLPGEGLAS